MIHANRFGEFEEKCAGGFYLADIWVEWLEIHTDARNQLAWFCYLHKVIGIMELCKFLWASAALIGLHITSPFIILISDHKVTPM